MPNRHFIPTPTLQIGPFLTVPGNNRDELSFWLALGPIAALPIAGSGLQALLDLWY